jgi:NAD(P)H-nitrite reductase large subunit
MTHRTGAILQRDGKTFAIVTRLPAGIVTPETLEKIAAVARKYQVPVVKLTSGQRIMMSGLRDQDLDPVFRDLGEIAGKETAPCVKYVETCLGTDVFRYGVQDSIELGLELEKDYYDIALLESAGSAVFPRYRYSPLPFGKLQRSILFRSNSE